MAPERVEIQGFLPDLTFESKIAHLRVKIEERRIERIRLGYDRPIIIVRDDDEYERRRNLPTLSGTNQRSDTRLDRLGNLYTTWYQHKRTKVEEDRRFLVNPQGTSYRVLHPRRVFDHYLDYLPKLRPVSELILGKTDIIEKAIRQQKHILDSYAPLNGAAADEIEFARMVIAYTESIAFRFLGQRRVTREDLALLARETGNFLEKVKIYDPRDERKRRVLDKLLLASEPDTLGRPNYLGVLGRALAAHTAAVERLTIGGLISDKFFRNLQILSYTRENYRWRFALAANQMEFVLAHYGFKKRGAKVDDVQRRAVINALRFIIENHLTQERVNPYLRSARWAAINIVGCRQEKKEINRQILGENVADDVFTRIPVSVLLMEGDFEESAKRIKQSVLQLRKTNANYEDIETAGKTT